jgi:hypothetical protein
MQVDQQKLNEFLERAVGDLAAGHGGVMVSLGRKLGLYKAMAGAGPLNSLEVAQRAGCAERYAVEGGTPWQRIPSQPQHQYI